jgi:hypothetical protein
MSGFISLGIGLLSTAWPSVRRQERIRHDDVRKVRNLAADDPVDRDGVERCVASGCDEEATEDPVRDIRVNRFIVTDARVPSERAIASSRTSIASAALTASRVGSASNIFE